MAKLQSGRSFSQAEQGTKTNQAIVIASCLTLVLVSPIDKLGYAESEHPEIENPSTDVSDPGLQTAAYLSIPEITLVDQDDRKLKLVADLMKDKVVFLNTIFTDCTTVCLPLAANTAKLQNILIEQLGETRVQDKVALVSLTVNPAIDMPRRLKTWRRKFGGTAGWTLLTGSQSDVDTLLKACGLFTADILDHPPIALIGNATTGRWNRISGLASPEKLAQMIVEQLNERIHTDSTMEE